MPSIVQYAGSFLFFSMYSLISTASFMIVFVLIFVIFIHLLKWFFSFFNSITNLIKVQGINTGFVSCYSLYSVERTATVTACPSGYSYLFIPQNGYRSVTRFSALSGTTASFQVTNINNNTQNVNATGWLVYYPSTWNIWLNLCNYAWFNV